MECSFSIGHYEYICRLISNSFCRTIFFDEEYHKDEKVILLRHDVDQSLEASLKMAEIEKEYGIKATYFIWLTSPFYNIFEKFYADIIHKIISLGHQIGLHFDERRYDLVDVKDLNYYINLECEIIERYFKTKLSAVSMHKPSKNLLESDLKLDKYLNTYNKKYMSKFKYISDSRMEWRDQCVCKAIENSKYDKLHILVHPFSWVFEGATLNDKAVNYIDYKLIKMDFDLSDNISVYKRLFNND